MENIFNANLYKQIISYPNDIYFITFYINTDEENNITKIKNIMNQNNIELRYTLIWNNNNIIISGKGKGYDILNVSKNNFITKINPLSNLYSTTK